MKKKLTSLLIKPSGADCNLDCSYCFYLDRAGTWRPGFHGDRSGGEKPTRRMSLDVLENLIQQAMEQGEPRISFGWQGGEPTLMGLGFYKKVVEFQKKYRRPGQFAENGFQTNGLLIDKSWCDFFIENDWLIGLSIDGPKEVHDHYRVTKNQKGSYDQVKRSADLMMSCGVKVNFLTVINDNSSQYAQDIYTHHQSAGCEFMQFIPCVERNPDNPSELTDFSLSASDYGEFLCQIFDLWKKDFKKGKPVNSVRFFDSIFHTYVGLCASECTQLEECGSYLVVEHNGDVYACDFFVESDWRLGSLKENSLLDLLNSTRQSEFGEMKSQLPHECIDCKWKPHCYGGCTKDRLKDPNGGGSNHFCESFKTFFEHADQDLKKLARVWKQEEALSKQQYLSELRAGQTHSRENQESGEPSRNAPCPCGSGKKFKKCCG